jgi:FG-GAP-like repeat
MRSRIRCFVDCLGAVTALTLGSLAFAQVPPALPPAPANGTPGTRPTPMPAINPVAGQPGWAPAKDFSDFLRKYYRVFKVEKELCKKLSPDRVFVGTPISRTFELVREDAQYYYIRNLPIEDPASPSHKQWLAQQAAEIRTQDREAYMRDKYIVVKEPDIYPPFTDTLDFVRMDAGLPRGGGWERSFDIADMNGDGRPDLVLPPRRIGDGKPSIYLQQKDGTWKKWEEVKWPSGIRLDYGTVRVADFNGDGHPDIAIASHFLPAYVLYGDGKGDFTKAEKLPVLNSDVTAQALTVADFNGDGRPDLALEAEIDVQMGFGRRFKTGLVNVLLNLPTGWKALGDDFPTEIFGYGLTTADFTHDGLPDLALTSRQQGVRDIVFQNVNKGEKWNDLAADQMPFNSFVFSVAAGALDASPIPDLLACYQQLDPWEPETPTQACTIYRFHDDAGKPLAVPRTELLLKREALYDNYLAVAIGDVDGDGRNDIAVVTTKGKLQLFLQFPDGHFYEQKSPLFDLGEDTMPTDVRIADLRGDGMGEIVVMGAPSGDKPGGGVWVFAPRKKGGLKARTGP